MIPEDLTVSDVVEALMLPTCSWEGNCYAIASGIVDAKLVHGTAVYGHWTGVLKGRWSRFAGAPFVRHGWVLLRDGRILDPTRWSFEADKPYIWLGANDGFYDEGGQALQMAVFANKPCPPTNKEAYACTFKVTAGCALHMLAISTSILQADECQMLRLTRAQAFWLANVPYCVLQPYEREIYRALEHCKMRSYIPIDNYRMAFRDKEQGMPDEIKTDETKTDEERILEMLKPFTGMLQPAEPGLRYMDICRLFGIPSHRQYRNRHLARSRQIDRALQRLRKAGKIFTKNQRWQLTTAEEMNK